MGAENIRAITGVDVAATRNSGILPVLGGDLAIALNVTAAPGTATLDVTIQYSGDGVTFVAPASAQAMTQVTTSPVAEVKRFQTFGKYFRVVATVGGGTPSYDFTVDVTMFT